MRRPAFAVVAGLLLAVVPTHVVADAPPRPIDRVPHAVPRAPETATYFEANRGQTAPQVDFVARCRGYVGFLTPGAATIATNAAALRMRFVGASETSRARALESAPGRSNYFIGNDPSKWTTDVPHFARVAYDGLLPGVDVVWRGDGTSMAYDLSLAPGVDASSVRLRFEGADSVAMNERGDVVLTIAGGTATMSAPRAWQDVASGRRDVAAAFVVGADGEVAFRVGAHDAAQRLVIDPSFTVSTFLGGLGAGTAMAIDPSDHLFVAGWTVSYAFPVTVGAFQTAKNGASASRMIAFVSKFAPSAASLVYSTYLGGTIDHDWALGLAVDSSGNACVCGAAHSSDFPIAHPYQSTGGGFLTKLNAAGSALIWSTRLTDPVGRVQFDSADGVYLHPSNWYATAVRNHVMKFDSSMSNLVYDVDLTTTGAGVKIKDFAVDPSGAVWAVGSTTTAGQASGTAFQSTYGGGGDGWIVQISPSGAVLYTTYVGGSGVDSVSTVRLDPWGDVYLTGTTTSTDFPTRNPYQSSNGGGGDVWVARMDASAASLVWSTYVGGPSAEGGWNGEWWIESDAGMSIDGVCETCIAVGATAPGFPMSNAVQASFAGGNNDVVFAEFSSDGSLERSSFLGGAYDDVAADAVFDGQNRPIVGGITSSSTFPITANAFQPGWPNGGYASPTAFVTGFPASGSPYTDVSPLDLPAVTVGAAYTAQLSVGGGASPLSWSLFVGPLPAGMSLSTSGVLSGTPTTTGVVSFMARVVDSAGMSAARRFRLTVNPPPAVATTTLPSWTVGRPYSAPLVATGGTAPFTWTFKSGTLPPGATVDSAGAVSAATALTQVGTFAFVVQVFDVYGVGATGSVSMTVNPLPRVTTPTPADAHEYRPIELQFAAVDGTPPYSWSIVSGAAPVDQPINAATGAIKGSATIAGDYAFTVRATDAAGAVADRDYAVHVLASPFLTTTELPWAALNRPYSFVVKEKGGVAPLAWSVAPGSNPAGVAIVPATGELVGTPTKAGRSFCTVRCFDVALAFDQHAYPFVVADAMSASQTINFKTSNGAPALRYVELLAGAELSIVVAHRGSMPVAVKRYDASQNPVDLGDAVTTKKGRVTVKKFVVPTTGRYFIELTPDASFKGRVSLRMNATPQTRFTGTATLDASGAPVVVPFLAPPGAKLSARVAPARKSAARPTISGVTDDAGTQLLVPKELRESKTGATLAARKPLIGGDCALTIAPRGGFAGDVVWTVSLKLPRRFSFALPDVPTQGPDK
jgi:hypothetical protein